MASRWMVEAEPSPRPSPGVPGEGGREARAEPRPPEIPARLGSFGGRGRELVDQCLVYLDAHFQSRERVVAAGAHQGGDRLAHLGGGVGGQVVGPVAGDAAAVEVLRVLLAAVAPARALLEIACPDALLDRQGAG